MIDRCKSRLCVGGHPQTPLFECHLGTWEDDEMNPRELKKPNSASDLCVDASVSFARHLQNQGIEAKVVDTHSLGKDAPKGVPHTVVESGGHIIDWTKRQFNRRAEVPSVEPSESFYERWEKGDETSLDDYPEVDDLGFRQGGCSCDTCWKHQQRKSFKRVSSKNRRRG